MPTTIRMPHDVRQQLRKEAFEREISMNEIIIEALNEHFKKTHIPAPYICEYSHPVMKSK